MQAVYLPHAKDLQGSPEVDLILTVSEPTGDAQPLGTAALTANLAAGPDGRGDPVTLKFAQPVTVEKGKTYTLALTVPNDAANQGASIGLAGDTIANEGDWDDGLPLRMDGYDPFGGLYPTGINFNMYTNDDPEKLSHFLQILNQSDYLLITSSRQWGSLPRIPERYPMTTLYYRNLIGCPAEKTIEWCYNVAQPGSFQGNLGYDLVKVFESDPGIGPLHANDQFAEEAFTVYDHPKVFVFHKSSNYDPMQTAQILGAVDFSQVIQIPPLQFASHPANLMLPSNLWAIQQAGGTWSQLFDLQALQNRYPAVSVILWYLSVFLLGLFIYPVLRLALPGLSDRGYPLARTAGMLVLSYVVWLAGSGGIPFSRLTISVVIALIALLGSLLAFNQRQELALELRQKRRYYLLIEALFLAFFIFDLLIRLGNPDLWHPYKGGEKPMDFSYFNAVLKSTTFPPYDPWFAGGYLNYYYYGFVFVGVLVKWLGIAPAVAYNLILPTIFAMIAMGAFSLGWNLISAVKNTWKERYPSPETLPAAEFTGSTASKSTAGRPILRHSQTAFCRWNLRRPWNGCPGQPGYCAHDRPGLPKAGCAGRHPGGQYHVGPLGMGRARFLSGAGWRLAALQHWRLVLESQSGNPGPQRCGADHRIPVFYCAVRRPACTPVRHANRPVSPHTNPGPGLRTGAMEE